MSAARMGYGTTNAAVSCLDVPHAVSRTNPSHHDIGPGPMHGWIFLGVDKLQERSRATENHPSKGPQGRGATLLAPAAATTWPRGRHLAVQPA